MKQPGKCVLIVDDDPQINEIMGALLTMAGHRVVRALSIVQARAALYKQRFDVTVLDLSLPDSKPQNTLLAIEGLKDLGTGRVVVITGTSLSVGAEIAAKQYGADECIEKLVGGFPESLLAAVAR